MTERAHESDVRADDEPAAADASAALPSLGQPLSRSDLLRLQRIAGNRATGVLARQRGRHGRLATPAAPGTPQPTWTRPRRGSAESLKEQLQDIIEGTLEESIIDHPEATYLVVRLGHVHVSPTTGRRRVRSP